MALAISALDIGTNKSRPPKAAGIAAIRKGVKELGLSTSALWQSMLSNNMVLNQAHELRLDKYEFQHALAAGLSAMLKTNLGVQPEQPKAVVKYSAVDTVYIKDSDYEAVQQGKAEPEMFMIATPAEQETNDAFKAKFGVERWDTTRLNRVDLQKITANTGIKFMQESVFDRFDKLSLEEQLLILEKVDSAKLTEAWSKKKNINEDDMFGRHLLRRRAYKAALDALTGVLDRKGKSRRHSIEYYAARIAQSYEGVDARELAKMYKATVEEAHGNSKVYDKCWDGYKKVPGKKRGEKGSCKKVKEGAVPDNRKIRILNKIMSKPLLANDIGAQMEAFFAIPDPLMVNEFRKQRSMGGDNVDLRPVVKGFINGVLHPDVQKLVNVNESIVNEYDDLSKEKDTIIKTISGLDATDKEQAVMLDRIYKILNSGQISSNIDVAFSKPLVDENLPEAEKTKIRKDMTKIIAGLEQDYGSMNKFLTRLEQQGGVVNVKELAKTLNTFENVFGDDATTAAFITLANYGVGKKQKGPGEYALACLSNQIKLAEGEGDLQIAGIGKVELKAALSSAGGRIGYGGGSQKSKRAVIDKYAQYLPTVLARLNAGGGGSISIRPFVDALNTDLPTNNPDNVKVRKALMSELLTMDLEKFAAPVVEKFATSMNFDEIETEYLKQNYAWYKDRDDFDALLLMHVPNRKTAMIRNAEDLIAFRNSGHANATSISIVPTQAGAGREQWAQLTLNKAKAG